MTRLLHNSGELVRPVEPWGTKVRPFVSGCPGSTSGPANYCGRCTETAAWDVLSANILDGDQSRFPRPALLSHLPFPHPLDAKQHRIFLPIGAVHLL